MLYSFTNAMASAILCCQNQNKNNNTYIYKCKHLYFEKITLYIRILIMPKTFSRMLYHVTMIKQNASSVILSCCDLPCYHFHSSEQLGLWENLHFYPSHYARGCKSKKPISDNFGQTCSRLKSDIPFHSSTEAHSVLMHNIVVLE